MRSPIDEYIIDKVREIRKLKRISQEEIAIKLDYESNAYIGSIESTAPERNECYNSKQLNLIAELLNCSPKDFWPDTPLKEYQPTRKMQTRRKSTNTTNRKRNQ
jgi:transcriptional regulator with XRE-family HTH domain